MGQIVIRRQPFNSHEASQLIPKLDRELSDMYPDWHALPHPGDDVGLKIKAADLNLKPNKDVKGSILNEAEPDLDALHKSDDGLSKDGQTNDALAYFVAYLVDSTTNEPDLPVGCMAVKVERYYPHHHPPEMYIDSIREQVKRDIETQANIKTAQLKRLFVEQAYRSGQVKPSIANALLEHCEGFARDDMHVRRLVVETGVRQIGAIKLYQRAEYSQIDNFGDYASTSVDKGGVSVCFAKLL